MRLAKEVRALMVCWLVLVLPAPAAARTPQQQAQGLLLQGDVAFARGEHHTALKRYLEARRLHHHPLLHYKLGLTLMAMERQDLAAEHLQRFVRHAGGLAPPASLKRAADLLALLGRSLGSLSVSCAVAGVQVSIDGRPVGRTPLARRLYLQPGRHRVQLRKAGYLDLDRELRLAAGVHRQLELLMKQGQAPAAQPAAAIPVYQPRPEAPLPGSGWQRDQRRRSRSIMAYTSLGVGLALLATAGALYGVGASAGADAHQQYLASNSQAEMDTHYGDVEDAQTLLTVGHVAAGTAAVALGLSIYAFATRPALGDETEPAAAVGLAISPAGAVLTLGGRF